MEPSLQPSSIEIQSHSSSNPNPNPTTTINTTVSMPSISIPNDDNQPKIEQQPDLPTQNPSFLPTDSDLDPVNLESENQDHDLHEDAEDQEGMMLSPSHQPSISDANIEDEKKVLPQSVTSSKRGPRRGKKASKINRRTLALIEKKVQTLSQNIKVIPFVPSKALDFSKHEENLRKLGLWDFAHLEFDRKIRDDLLVKLIVNFNDKNRFCYVDDCKIMVNPADLARALNLPLKKNVDCGEEEWPGDFISFVEDFVSNWMLLHEDTWMLPPEVMRWTGLIKEGHPEKVEWAKLIWFMIKRELLKGVQLENCYYASHLQHLIKCQKEDLLKTKIPDEVEEIHVVKDDEEEETDVKMAECDEFENVQQNVVDIPDVQIDQNLENVGAVDRDGLVENLKTTCDSENLEVAGDHVKRLEMDFDNVKNLDTPSDFKDPETADDHVKEPETVVDHVKELETVVDHGKSLETSSDHVESVEPTGDHVESVEPTGEHAEKLETTGDHVMENRDAAGDDDVENLNIVGDNAEKMQIDGDLVEDTKVVTGDVAEEIKTEADVVIADDVQIHVNGGNDLMMDFDGCKEDEHDMWNLSRKDDEQEYFLQQCTMSQVKVNGEQTRQVVGEPQEIEDDDDDDHDEQVEGFDALQKCNSFNGLSSGHMMQAMDSSQIPYTRDFGDQSAMELDNHMMLGGPSSIFGNAQKRELDLDPEISGHKRLRTDVPSWDQKPPDMEWCVNQMQELAGKTRMAYMSYQQSLMSEQQVLYNELEAKDRVIHQLNMNIEELQRIQQVKLARYDDELFAMTRVIDGYRKALKSTQQAFTEYRKRAKLPLEPLYKDAGEGGGVVKSVAELERERVKREEDERVARVLFMQKCEKLEMEWEMKFEGHVEQVEKLGARLSGIEKGVEDLKESISKRKASETVA